MKVEERPISNVQERPTQLDSSNSITCAIGILEAWEQNNLDLLRNELDRATSTQFTPVSSDEYERIELLEGIASEMRGMVAHGRIEDAGIYFNLLRHLATPEMS